MRQLCVELCLFINVRLMFMLSFTRLSNSLIMPPGDSHHWLVVWFFSCHFNNWRSTAYFSTASSTATIHLIGNCSRQLVMMITGKTLPQKWTASRPSHTALHCQSAQAQPCSSYDHHHKLRLSVCLVYFKSGSYDQFPSLALMPDNGSSGWSVGCEPFSLVTSSRSSSKPSLVGHSAVVKRVRGKQVSPHSTSNWASAVAGNQCCWSHLIADCSADSTHSSDSKRATAAAAAAVPVCAWTKTTDCSFKVVDIGHRQPRVRGQATAAAEGLYRRVSSTFLFLSICFTRHLLECQHNDRAHCLSSAPPPPQSPSAFVKCRQCSSLLVWPDSIFSCTTSSSTSTTTCIITQPTGIHLWSCSSSASSPNYYYCSSFHIWHSLWDNSDESTKLSEAFHNHCVALLLCRHCPGIGKLSAAAAAAAAEVEKSQPST